MTDEQKLKEFALRVARRFEEDLHQRQVLWALQLTLLGVEPEPDEYDKWQKHQVQCDAIEEWFFSALDK